MPWHVVETGECLASIARQYGFLPDTIWNDGQNASLRERRTHNVLLKGDAIFIPEHRLRTERVATDRRHSFVRRAATVSFRLKLLARDGTARSGLRYTITIDGRPFDGTTDANGVIERDIPADAREGLLFVQGVRGGERYPLKLGHLDPPDAPTGLAARLRNLGFDPGPDPGPPTGDPGGALPAALRAFQQANGLEPSGTADEATRAKLIEVHGS